MKNTYEKILKYLIEHDVELNIKTDELSTILISTSHKNRHSRRRIHKEDYLADGNNFERIIANNLSKLFPSFKDFNTPIKH